jgi:hypothetical protein
MKPLGNHAIDVLAKLAAKRKVQEQLREQGIRVTLVKPADIAAQTERYLAANPHLYEEAMQQALQMGLLAERNS